LQVIKKCHNLSLFVTFLPGTIPLMDKPWID